MSCKNKHFNFITVYCIKGALRGEDVEEADMNNFYL